MDIHPINLVDVFSKFCFPDVPQTLLAFPLQHHILDLTMVLTQYTDVHHHPCGVFGVALGL